MRLVCDCHTHTVYSHGKNTASEMIAAAAQKGLSGIYITEHGPYHLQVIKHFPGKDWYMRLREEIEKEKRKYPGMDIRFGTEANVISLDGETDISDKWKDAFEFINVGYHMMVPMKDLKSEFSVQGRTILCEKLGMRKLYPSLTETLTDTMLRVLDNYGINMITHPTRYYPMDMDRIAEKCSRTGTLLEINAAKGLLGAEDVKRISERYPSVRFAVGSDAHRVEDVGNVKRGLDIAAASGAGIGRIVNIEE